VASVGAPDIERAFAASHALVATIVFVIPGAIAFVVEPIVFALADRYPRAPIIRAGTLAMAVGAGAAAIAPGPWTFALALAILWPAIGCASGLAQATLVDAAEHARARTIARFSLFALAGDIVAPALLAIVDWRVAFAIVAALLAAWTIVLARARLPSAAMRDDAEPRAPLLASLRAALSDRVLLAWLVAVALCDLLDEILIVFASLRVRDDMGASAAWQGAFVALFVVGGALGLAAMERALRRWSELATLAGCAIACAIVYAAWLAVGSPLAVALLALPLGATAAPLYPLAAARAYAARPGASGEVLAVSHLLTPVGLALPFAIGAIADAVGVTTALALLVVQPVALAAMAMLARRRA
jgi:MFS family permease